MKPYILLILMVLISVPARAQDDSGGFGYEAGFDNSGGGDSFDGDSGGQVEERPALDLLVDLRSWLAKAKAPAMDKKQEKDLKKLQEKEVKAMSKVFAMQFGVSLETAVAARTPARGRRATFNRPDPEQNAEIQRLSEELMNKIIAALRLDQQTVLRKYQSEQLRVRRLNLTNESIADAGLKLTAEQKAEVEAIYARESRLRTLIIIEAKGAPHQATVRQLEAQTSERVVQVLDQTQKVAFVQALAGGAKTSDRQP